MCSNRSPNRKCHGDSLELCKVLGSNCSDYAFAPTDASLSGYFLLQFCAVASLDTFELVGKSTLLSISPHVVGHLQVRVGVSVDQCQVCPVHVTPARSFVAVAAGEPSGVQLDATAQPFGQHCSSSEHLAGLQGFRYFHTWHMGRLVPCMEEGQTLMLQLGEIERRGGNDGQ